MGYVRFITQTEALHIEGDYVVVSVLAPYYKRIQMLSIDCCPVEMVSDITLLTVKSDSLSMRLVECFLTAMNLALAYL